MPNSCTLGISSNSPNTYTPGASNTYNIEKSMQYKVLLSVSLSFDYLSQFSRYCWESILGTNGNVGMQQLIRQHTVWRKKSRNPDIDNTVKYHAQLILLSPTQGNYATSDNSDMCQSGERRRSGHLYTEAVGYQIKLRQHYASYWQLHLHEVTIKWQMTLSKALVGLSYMY